MALFDYLVILDRWQAVPDYTYGLPESVRLNQIKMLN